MNKSLPFNVNPPAIPELYQEWPAGLLQWERQHNSPDNRFVFVNAWNEWAEGAHLEPDSWSGYAYLEATKRAMGEKR